MDSYYNNTNNFIGGGVEEEEKINKYEKYFLFTGIYTALSILIIIICMSIYESNKDITVQNGIFGFMIFYTVSILIGSYWMGYKNKLITTMSDKLKTEFDVDLESKWNSTRDKYIKRQNPSLTQNVQQGLQTEEQQRQKNPSPLQRNSTREFENARFENNATNATNATNDEDYSEF